MLKEKAAAGTQAKKVVKVSRDEAREAIRKLAEGGRCFIQALRRGKLVIKRKAAQVRRKYKKVGIIVNFAAAHKIVRVIARSQTAPSKPGVNAQSHVPEPTPRSIFDVK